MECKLLQLLLFVCMKLLVSGVGAGAEVTCIKRERQALLKFKESLTGGDLSYLMWGSEDDKGECCDWYGVGCSEASVDYVHVYSIELPDLHLTGNISKISPALRELQHLGTLFLRNNNFTIDNLNWLSDVSSLSNLDLSGINLRNVTNWVQPIMNLSSLETLYLRGCQLRDTLSAFDVFDPPSSLKILDLSYNQISGSLFELSGFSSLQELDFSGNKLKKLPKFEKFSNLESLTLSSTSLEGTITEHHLSNLTQLTLLDLSFNNVSFNFSFDWIPPFQLEAICLSHCNLGPYFPNWIRTQNSLRDLSLSFAGISDTLPDWLWNMSSIVLLDLSHNQISGRIPYFRSELNHYMLLDLSYNNLSGPIPSSVIQCSKELILSGNMLLGSIFNLCTISENSTIKFLTLSDNQLDGELPDCWMNLTGLTALNLANNKLSGKIPPTLGTLEYLAILHLGNNSFTGELPSSLKNCAQLRKLDVGGNKLRGTIPAWIGTHLTNLAVLSLRFNRFHGSIPPTICYLTDIHVLDLSRNNISGTIPRCLNYFTSLIQNDGSPILEYNYHLVDEGIPRDDDDNALIHWKGQESEYKRLRNLKGIDLSSNKLVGNIPQEFSDLRGLVFFNLSRNHLKGNIISKIGQLDTLEWLDLSRNQLFGEIPNGLANLHFLSVLDLSYNNLTGKIPLSTQLQSFDPSAYAGNNQLCGDPLARVSS